MSVIPFPATHEADLRLMALRLRDKGNAAMGAACVCALEDVPRHSLIAETYYAAADLVLLVSGLRSVTPSIAQEG